MIENDYVHHCLNQIHDLDFKHPEEERISPQTTKFIIPILEKLVKKLNAHNIENLMIEHSFENGYTIIIKDKNIVEMEYQPNHHQFAILYKKVRKNKWECKEEITPESEIKDDFNQIIKWVKNE